jgi:hypothetical protein
LFRHLFISGLIHFCTILNTNTLKINVAFLDSLTIIPILVCITRTQSLPPIHFSLTTTHTLDWRYPIGSSQIHRPIAHPLLELGRATMGPSNLMVCRLFFKKQQNKKFPSSSDETLSADSPARWTYFNDFYLVTVLLGFNLGASLSQEK